MIKMFEIQIESFSEKKGYFLDSRSISISLPDNTEISRIYIINNETSIKYELKKCEISTLMVK